MSTTPPASPVVESSDRPRFLAIEVGDWPGLEQPVRLELDPRTTVLVGKNGAGKSLLVEGWFLAVMQTLGLQSAEDGPRHFRCDLKASDVAPFGYERRIEEAAAEQLAGTPSVENASLAALRARTSPLTERAFRLEDGSELWHSRNLRRSPGDSVAAEGGGLRSVLYHGDLPAKRLEIQALNVLLPYITMIAPGTLRRRESAQSREARRAVLLQWNDLSARRPADRLRWTAVERSEVDELGEAIMQLSRTKPSVFQEFRDVLAGLDLVRDLTIELYKKDRVAPSAEPAAGEIAAVLFDGANLGMCSDGTLRIAKIVLELLRPGTVCLLIEEPETAVHPGLLDKLLALVDAYSTDRQIVLSTHSPQVVDHFAPDQLRLVEREQGVTRVHSLSAADRDLAVAYLRDQGALSDFVFRRSDG